MEMRYTTNQRSSLTIEKRADGGSMLAGYAAVFYRADDPGTEYELWPAMGTWPRVVERIMPGAFDRAVKEDDVRGLLNHNPEQLLARTRSRTMRLSIDSIGLRYEMDLPDTQTARDAAAMILRGDMSGSSFKFGLNGESSQRWTETPEIEVREILAVDPLYDVGPVTFPAYESTTAGIRNIPRGERDEARVAWQQWKDRIITARSLQRGRKLLLLEIAGSKI